MAAPAAPCYITSLPVGGYPVRFYSSPRDVPDYPLFAYVDMLAAAGLPIDTWETWFAQGRDGWPELTHDLTDGTMLVAMNVGDLLLTWLVGHGWDHVAELRPAWEDAWSAVFCSQHLDLTGETLKRYMQLATLNCIPASAARAAGAAH